MHHVPIISTLIALAGVVIIVCAVTALIDVLTGSDTI